MQITDRRTLKNKIKELKAEQNALRQQMQSLPKQESKHTNEHLPRTKGRYTSSLNGTKVPKQLLLRSTTINLIANKASQEGLSLSETVDKILEHALATECQTDNKPLSFKIGA